MALIKIERDKPEVIGGNTVALIEESALPEAMENGWRPVAEKKSKPSDEKKPDEPKGEETVKVDEPKGDVTTGKKVKKTL